MGCCGGRKLPEQGRRFKGQPGRTTAVQLPLVGVKLQTAASGREDRELLRRVPQQPVQTPGTQQRAGTPLRQQTSPVEAIPRRRISR